MQQTKKFKMADAISPYLAVSCGLIVFLRDAPEGPNVEIFLGPNPPMTNFVTKTHFVTIEIFLYDVDNPLGSMHKKSLRTGGSGKCRNLRSNTKVIYFCDDRSFSPELNCRRSIISQQIKPKLQNIFQKVLRSLNEMSYDV